MTRILHNVGGPLSDDRLASEIGIFFLAGFETTGHSGAWLLYLVSQHPEVEAKICTELDQLGLLKTGDRPNPRQVMYDDLGKLTYLDMAIKVSRRLFHDDESKSPQNQKIQPFFYRKFNFVFLINRPLQSTAIVCRKAIF